MAKLKARGREEVFRVEKSTSPQTAGVAEVRHFRATMSDGSVLERTVLQYTPEEAARNYGEKSHDYGWKVRGRAKAGRTLEELLKTYLDAGWQLASASPSYFTVRGDSVEAHSQEPFISEEKATKRRTHLTSQRAKAAEKRAAEDAPGFYVTNGYTASLTKSRVADHPKPFKNYEEAEEFAVRRYRYFTELSLNYLLPVLVVASDSRQDAETGRGDVLWVDGTYRGPTPDPRQTSLF